jgi:hypothetical protein
MDFDHIQVVAFQIIAVLTLAMPALEKIAEMTSNKVDNAVVDFLAKLLSYVPRVRMGNKP